MQTDSITIINKINDLIVNAKAGFGRSKLIDVDELGSLLNELEIQLNVDYQQSQKIATQRELILKNAQDKAAQMEHEAREKAKQLVEENAITVEARRTAAEVEHEAKMEAGRIVAAAKQEADRIKAETSAELENKEKVTREYIETRLERADSVLADATESLDESANRVMDILDEVRRLYESLTGLEAFGFMDTNA